MPWWTVPVGVLWAVSLFGAILTWADRRMGEALVWFAICAACALRLEA